MVEELTPEEVHEVLQSDETVHVVDTRPPAAYEDGHIPGAENLPYARLADEIADVDWGSTVILVCEEGISSLQAGRILESYEGIDEETEVANLSGGYEEWEYELETGEN